MDTLSDRRDLPVFIHSELDDLGLSTRAFRLYCHLARRAGQGVAWPSYQSMGDKCYSGDSDNADTRRTWAIRAMKELVDRGLIRKEQRADQNQGDATNLYFLTPRSDWVSLGGSDGVSPGGVMGYHRGSDGVSPKGIPIKGSPSLKDVVVVVGDDDPALGEVFQLWQDNMPGSLTPIISDSVKDLCSSYGASEVKFAILEAVKSNARNLRYIQAILVNRAAGRDKPTPANVGPAGNGKWVPAQKQTNVDRSMAAVDAVFARFENGGSL